MAVALAAVAVVGAGGGSAERPAVAVDDTPPRIDPTVTGPRGQSGWYVGNVTVSFTVSDPESRVTDDRGCGTTTVRADTAGTDFTCWAMNEAGLEGSYTVRIKRDATEPTVTGAAPGRAADRAPWFNAPVVFTFAGTDVTAGIAECDRVRYAGPDAKSGAVDGTCTDSAGNVGEATVPIAYDSTPPKVKASFGRKPDRYGWYARRILIRFSGRDAVSGVLRCTRRLAYRGPNSAEASRTGTCVDKAGNRRSRAFTFRYSQPLLSPPAGTRLKGRPLLEWIDVPRARYYNVQLWRGGKVLSRWPQVAHKKLAHTWSYRGVRHRLEPGRYTWYVWPRFRDGYGRLIGKSSFVIRRG